MELGEERLEREREEGKEFKIVEERKREEEREREGGGGQRESVCDGRRQGGRVGGVVRRDNYN